MLSKHQVYKSLIRQKPRTRRQLLFKGFFFFFLFFQWCPSAFSEMSNFTWLRIRVTVCPEDVFCELWVAWWDVGSVFKMRVNQTDLSKHTNQWRRTGTVSQSQQDQLKDTPFHQAKELYDSVCPWFSLGHSELKCESLKPLCFKGLDAEGIWG